VRRADTLKRLEGQEILIPGSHTLWTDLLAHNLVDELHLVLGHATATGGTPIFPGPQPRPLRLREAPRT
jgi:dihydrofolate reductase